MSTLQPEVPTKAIRALRLRLQTVKKYLEPLLSKPLTETYTKLPLAERCEFEILLSYALNTLYYIYLRTQGSDPQSHDVMTELARIQDYIMKIKVLRGEGPKPTLKVDSKAAARFIRAAIGENKPNKETVETTTISDDSSSDEEAVVEISAQDSQTETVKGEGGKRKIRERTDPFKSKKRKE